MNNSNYFNICSICWDKIQFELKTNCGHIFCLKCMINALEYDTNYTFCNKVKCPYCRQIVKYFFNSSSSSYYYYYSSSSLLLRQLSLSLSQLFSILTFKFIDDLFCSTSFMMKTKKKNYIRNEFKSAVFLVGLNIFCIALLYRNEV